MLGKGQGGRVNPMGVRRVQCSPGCEVASLRLPCSLIFVKKPWVSLRALPPRDSHGASFGLPAVTALGLTRGVCCFQAGLSRRLESSTAGTEVPRRGGYLTQHGACTSPASCGQVDVALEPSWGPRALALHRSSPERMPNMAFNSWALPPPRPEASLHRVSSPLRGWELLIGPVSPPVLPSPQLCPSALP